MAVEQIADRALGLVPPVEEAFVRPRRRDVAISALLALGCLVEFPFLDTPYPGFALVIGLLWAALASVRLVWPLPVVALTTLLAIAGDLLAAVTGEPMTGTLSGGLAVMLILYSVGRWAPQSTVFAALVLAVVLLPATGFLNSANDPAWAWYLAEVASTLALVAIGVLVRFQSVLKTQRARAELAEERNNLANDVHDSVAHHMSAIAILAEGARQLGDQEQRDQAFDAIKQSASAGLTDVRRLVTDLRTTDELPAPLPTLGDIHRLGRDSTTQTLTVDVVMETESEVIPPTVAAVAYSIVREALTNVRRHATGATRATVRARTTEDFLDLTVSDNGSTPTGGSTSSGFGLGVMTERANSVDGSLSAGPSPTGGWLVAARLPIAGDGGK